MTKTFYRVYRPQKFDELVGQELVRLTLKQAVKENRIAHAYLFTGPRGTGKTTTARIFSKAVNCLTPLEERKEAEPCDQCKNCLTIMSSKTLDLMEIDAASYTGVDNIRQLTENINLSPADLKYRIFIIDEVHMLSRGAFNALLKTLEEPPTHTIFILATTEQHKVPLTITSRCQRFSFSLLSLPEILKKLSTIAKKEKITIDKESIEMISEAAHGGMRDAESLLAQVVTLAGREIKATETRDILGIAGRDDEIKLMGGLFEKNVSETVDQLEQMNKNGMDIFLLSHRLLDYLRKIIFIKLNPRGAGLIAQEISESQVDQLKKLAAKITITDLLGLTAKLIQAQPSIKNSSYPHLALE
jgi:DNA polymerase-3 subunit gamma/tau